MSCCIDTSSHSTALAIQRPSPLSLKAASIGLPGTRLLIPHDSPIFQQVDERACIRPRGVSLAQVLQDNGTFPPNFDACGSGSTRHFQQHSSIDRLYHVIRAKTLYFMANLAAWAVGDGLSGSKAIPIGKRNIGAYIALIAKSSGAEIGDQKMMSDYWCRWDNTGHGFFVERPIVLRDDKLHTILTSVPEGHELSPWTLPSDGVVLSQMVE